MVVSVNTLEQLILMWAEERNIIRGSEPNAQFLKLTEELGELAHGLCRGDDDEIKDAIGDMMVVLSIMCGQMNTSLAECMSLAYDEIKNRKGKMVDGVFVKEEDL